MTRVVLSVMIALLVLAGFAAAIAVFVVVHSHHGTAVAAIAGVGTALVAWSSAALLGLAMEMADSLNALVWASERDDNRHA